MSRLTNLAASIVLLLALPESSIRGQSPRQAGLPITRTPPPQQADLLVSDVHFTSDGKVQVTIRNNGLTPIASQVTTSLALNDISIAQLNQAGLGATTSATVKFDPAASTATGVKLALAKCETVTLRAEVRGAASVQEATATNNLRVVSTRPACPDLLVTEIKQDWEDFNTRYRVQLTIANRGTGTLASTARVYAGAIENATSIPDPIDFDFAAYGMPHVDIGPLQPGQTTTFHLPGKHLGTQTVAVLVRIDPDRKVPELDRSNNQTSKVLGPH